VGQLRGQDRQDGRSERRLGNGFGIFQHFGRLDCIRRVAKKKAFEIVGVDNAEKLENDMLTTLRSKTKFNIKLSPQAKKYKIDGKTVLAFYIPSSDIKPVYFNGVQNTFIRTGSGDQEASEFEINVLYRDQKFGTMSGKVVEGTSVESLNAESYSNFAIICNEWCRVCITTN